MHIFLLLSYLRLSLSTDPSRAARRPRAASLVGPMVCLALDYHETFNISMKNFNNRGEFADIRKDMITLALPQWGGRQKIERGRKACGARHL
jgi:hypothetical protein